jgi:WD40 repeat protein
MKKLILLALFACLAFRISAQNNIRITSFYDWNDRKAYYLVWDTKTGKSVQYYWNSNDSKWDAFEINLPAMPLPGAKGSVMMDVFYDSNDDKAYYLVWDAKGGKSIQYYWNSTGNKWDSFEINLAAAPLPGAVGDIGMKMYYDSNDKKAYYIVWDCSTGKSIQYYWNSGASKWDAFEINLPASPLAR